MEAVAHKTMKQEHVRQFLESSLLDADRVALVSKRMQELQLRMQVLREKERQIAVK